MYWSADLFIAMLGKVARNLGRASFMAVASGGSTGGVHGRCSPVQLPADHADGTPCEALVHGIGPGLDVKIPLTCARSGPQPAQEEVVATGGLSYEVVGIKEEKSTWPVWSAPKNPPST